MTEKEGAEIWVRAKAFDVGVGVQLPRMAIRNLDAKLVERATGELVLRISTWIAARRHPVEIKTHVVEFQPEPKAVEFEVPASWWQHFKKERFPAWALKLWPVQTTTLSGTAEWEKQERTVTYEVGPFFLCPHLNKIADREHLIFLQEARAEDQ